jgi:hypothetical protein
MPQAYTCYAAWRPEYYVVRCTQQPPSCYLQPVLIREANQDHGRICRLLQQPVVCVWYQYNTRGWSMKCEIKQLP